MKKHLAVITAAIAMTLTACGGGSDTKGLFSLWKNTENGAPLDLSNAAFNTPLFPTFILPETQCICEAIIVGDHGSGSFGLSRCISTPYNASVNAQCQALNGAGTYSNNGSILTLNFGGGTATYR